MGDRLYTSYWQGGFVILDISDLSNPKHISGLDWSPPFPCPTHSAVPVPFEINGRKILVVADEDVFHLFPGPPAFIWIVDITVEERPVPFATFQIDALDGAPQPKATGCHQPIEKISGTEIPAAWFAHGMRIIDIALPRAPREVAYFVPDPAPGAERPASNDVFGRPRADLPGRPRARISHPGAGLGRRAVGENKPCHSPLISLWSCRQRSASLNEHESF